MPKAAGSGAIEIEGTAGATPVPPSTSVVVTAPVVETVRVAVSAPTRDGVKINLTVQVPAAASEPPLAHVPVPALAKSALFVPVTVK